MAQRNEQPEARMKRSVALLRADREPPPAAEGRVLAALEARLGGPPDGGDADHGSSGGDGGSAGYANANVIYAAKTVAATVALTTAGLLGLRLVASAVEAPSQPPPVAAAAPIVADTRDLADTAEPAQPLDAAAADTAESPRQHRAQTQPAPVTATRPARSTDPPGEAVSADTMAAELALIDAARAASDPAATITALETHAHSFPAGLLSDEREALWVLAECELGTLDAATRRAQRFVDHRPHSPLVDRIVNACPEVGERLTNLDAAGHGAGEGPTPER